MSDFDSYGPLQVLIGSWSGESGKDVSPESDGIEENTYRETISFEPIGEVVNAEVERLMVLRYQQEVFRIRDSKRIHDQQGYWMWNKESQSIIHTFVIPRGVSVIAGGNHDSSSGFDLKCKVKATCDSEAWPITETTFLRKNARTLRFEMEVRVKDGALTYSQLTNLDIYGGTFEHTEESVLHRA